MNNGTRRPRGSGSYAKRGAGTYRLTVRDPDGGPRRTRTVKARNDTEARKALHTFVAEVNAGKIAANNGRRTVAQACDAWMERRLELMNGGHIVDGTYSHNEWAVGHIVRRVGKRQLKTFERPAPVEDLYAELGIDLTPKSVKEVASVLSQILEFARRRDWIRMNGARGISPESRPRVNLKPVIAPDDQEIDRLLRFMEERNFSYFAFTIVGAAAGGSRHEILGLQRRDVELNEGFLWFRRGVTLARTHAKGTDRLIVSDRLKTSSRRRRVAIGQGTVAVLREHLRCLDEVARDFGHTRFPDEGFLFTADPTGGRPLLPDSINKRFAKLCRRAGVKVTLHQLRHYAATVVAPHLTETEMMGRFGWRTSAMVRRYADYRELRDREAAHFADRALGLTQLSATKQGATKPERKSTA